MTLDRPGTGRRGTAPGLDRRAGGGPPGWPRPRRVALAVLLSVVQVAGSHAAAHGQLERSVPDALGVALLLVGPAFLLLPGRPLTTAAGAMSAAALYLGLGYVYGPVVLSPAVALVIAVATGHRYGAWAVAGFGWLVAFLGLGATDGTASLARALGAAVWVVAVVSVGELVRTRRERAAERQRAGAEADRRVASEERLAIARDLHDGVAHHISLMNMRAGVALHLLRQEARTATDEAAAGGTSSDTSRESPALAEARAALEVVKQASAEALAELRSALGVLRAEGEAAPRHPVPGLEGVDDLVTRWRGAGLDVRLTGVTPSQAAAALPLSLAQAGYRVVQESLTNVSRHSRAGWARVGLELDGAGLRLEIADPGPARGPGEAGGGRGLLGMQERVAALGGSLEAGRREDGGWVVKATIPARSGEGH